MSYSKKKKLEVAYVLEMCNDYFKQSPYVDIVWSDKFGWIYLTYDPIRKDFPLGPDIIPSGKWLFKRLIREITDDVTTITESENTLETMNEVEKNEIRRRVAPYLEKLPEYQSVYDRLLG